MARLTNPVDPEELDDLLEYGEQLCLSAQSNFLAEQQPGLLVRLLSAPGFNSIIIPMFRKVILPYDKETAQERLKILTKKYRNSFFTQATRETVVRNLYLKLYEGEKTILSSKQLYQSLAEAEPIKIYDRSGPGIAKVYEQSVREIGLSNVLPTYGMNIPMVGENLLLRRMPFLITPEYNSTISSEPMVGINVPTRYVGGPYSYTPMHPEDGGLDSINAVLWSLYADAKLWHFILLDDLDKALVKFTADGTELFNFNASLPAEERLPLLDYPNYKSGCPFPDNHKAFLRSLRYVDEAGVTSQFVIQQAGDIIYVAPGVLHQVINLCTNEAEAVNVGSRLWGGVSRQVRRCYCKGSQIVPIDRPPDYVGHHAISRRFQHECPYDGCICAYDVGSDFREHLLWHNDGDLEAARARFPQFFDGPVVDYFIPGGDLSRHHIVTEYVEGSMLISTVKPALPIEPIRGLDVSVLRAEFTEVTQGRLSPKPADLPPTSVFVGVEYSDLDNSVDNDVSASLANHYSVSDMSHISLDPLSGVPTDFKDAGISIPGASAFRNNSSTSSSLTVPSLVVVSQVDPDPSVMIASATVPVSPPLTTSDSPASFLLASEDCDTRNDIISGTPKSKSRFATKSPLGRVVKEVKKKSSRRLQTCEKCGRRLVGGHLSRHLRTCGVLMSCEFCGLELPALGLSRHRACCPSRRIALVVALPE
ncbi:hypothetical protein QAD02_020855 [Eretmocerus hayati]|uniref:Uncharacterized protein n=1 Tax=Eretmocerus hayati TaxID=131215 RepID=A0ACC2PRS5_9HYME|nr:hypothetical protein QAD02_020855 [Eretmocerus hayati]